MLTGPLNDELIETLEEIEMERNNLLLGENIYNQPATKTKPKASSYRGITTEDVDRIENITKADLQEAIAKSFQETMSQATKTLGNSKKSANKRAENLMIRRFLSDLIREKGNVTPDNDYNYDLVDDITDSIASITLNKVTINAIKSAVRHALRETPLEETIRKILQSEPKLIFPAYFSFSRNSSPIVPKDIVALMELKVVYQSNTPSVSKDSDESSLEED
ncbi:9621_t:CDS:2 [Funneliformis geosporum]|uniref:9621_t:CDS:1 n=1 Tax=Funneliformis geosporum TaxID=1117311 RepID=A0A9W4SSH7_9GLOM|nr:9621_t:CDS:2 [Funneliformis geosporum]